MKRIFFFIAAGLMTASIASAQVETAQPTIDNPNAPEINFSKSVHDYGTVYKEGDGTCEFQFTNTGKEPLVISNVRSSCGCTVPKWTREPILPGQAGTINVKYDTKRLGAINKTITVLSNAKTPSVVLRIKGNVVDAPSEAAPVNSGAQGATPKVN